MIFTTFSYFIFLPLVFIFYYLIPHRFRWMFLFLVSSLFYGLFSWKFLLLFYLLILFNYFIGLKMYTSAGVLRRPCYLAGILGDVMILITFKYLPSFNEGVDQIFSFLQFQYQAEFHDLILPIGLSFLIFTMISYLVDIKRKIIVAEKHPGILSVYLMFFPKILQGPIERAGDLLPQFRKKQSFSYANVTGGLRLMAWGFFKKLVIADTIAIFVNPVFSDHDKLSGPFLILGIILFAFQLYADFSGYTDIAMGSAKILGFDLTQNFRGPFLATSIKEFWSRWHISFSSWLRDYLFLPLAYFFSKRLKSERILGIMTEKWIYLFSAMITFAICGLWHGNGLNFLIWGVLMGIFLSYSQWTGHLNRELRKKFHILKASAGYRFYKILITFSLVCFSLIFFRAATTVDALRIITGAFSGWSFTEIKESWRFLDSAGMNPRIAGIITISLLILILTDIAHEKKNIFQRVSAAPGYVRWSVYYLVILLIIVYGAVENRQFIYLQF